MSTRLLIDIPGNWTYSVALEPEKVYRIGRTSDNDVRIPDNRVSSRHAEFLNRDNRWYVRDLGSRNGTYVDGKRVGEAVLADGDLIRIADVEIIYQGPEKADRQQDWTGTVRALTEKQLALQGAADQARNHRDASPLAALMRAEHTPMVAEDDRPLVSPTKGKPASDAPFKEVGPVQGNDLLWVADTLADILTDVLSHPGERDVLFKRILTRLQKAVSADNGFLMIPDLESKRWVIRAWVGDAAEWTDYEKSHPVPLTVANWAYQNTKVASNTYREGANQDLSGSSSMKMLNVNSYIAVPLADGGQCRGVLYFDTRDSAKAFLPRDIKLLERAGSFILEIEDQKKG